MEGHISLAKNSSVMVQTQPQGSIKAGPTYRF